MKYQVIDRHTQKVIGTYATAAAARRVRDRKDSEYGSCRYSVRFAGRPVPLPICISREIADLASIASGPFSVVDLGFRLTYFEVASSVMGRSIACLVLAEDYSI